MGLPIVEDVFNAIKFSINFFIDKTPKPIQILIFLVLLLLFGNMMSWMLHIAGVHCNADYKPVKMDTINIVSNVKIFWWVAKGDLDTPTATIDDVHPWTRYITLQGNQETCVFILKYDGEKYVQCDNLSDPTCLFYYKNAECFNCSVTDIGWFYEPGSWWKWYWAGEVCGGDATRISDRSTWLNIKCDTLCSIPEHYAWNVSEGNYYCIDLDYCGVNATKEVDSRVDEELKNGGAELMYPGEYSRNIDTFIQIKCSKNFNPRLAVYNLDVFDFRVWILIIVVYVMFIFLSKVKRH